MSHRTLEISLKSDLREWPESNITEAVIYVPVSDARGPTGLVGEDEAPTPAGAPNIMLGPLETKSCLDELSDGVQSMDVR